MRDKFCSYYTNCEVLKNYMVDMLRLENGDVVLEPSAGDGMLIDGILERQKNVIIDCYDVDGNAISILEDKYKTSNKITIYHSDTLLDTRLDEYSEYGGYYDKIIANPPYGAYQSIERRELLKKKYNGHYVKETYSLFLLRCLKLLKRGGILTFIIPETYLYLNRFKSLREYILSTFSIEEILIFPSKFFPGVDFGYSDLSIITIRNNKSNIENNNIRIYKGFKSKEEISELNDELILEELEIFNLSQCKVLNRMDSVFLLNSNEKMINIIDNNKLTLGDIADCVTGIYTGNNTKFIKKRSDNVKRAKNYDIVDMDKTYNGLTDTTGIPGNQYYIPIIKGNSEDKFIRKEYNWYIDWSVSAINHYKNDKKARFQNERFYFKKGIVCPSLKSKIINATLIDNVLFDMSMVGIFPKDKKYLYFLLGLLNSNIAHEFLSILNPTINNTANYMKKLPIVLPDEDRLDEFNMKVKEIIDRINEGKENENEMTKMNEMYEGLYIRQEKDQ